MAKYITVTGMANTAISYGINKKTWAGFSKEMQRELYFKFRLAANHMSEGYTKLEDRGFEGLKAAGNEIIILEPEEKKRWVAVGDEVWKSFAKDCEGKGLPGNQFVRDFRAAAAKYNAMSIRQIREYVQDPKNMIHGIIDGF